jgi:DNA polymerase-3 subunit beta
MKIECVKEKFLNAVALAEKVTGKNLTLPILSCVLLETTQSGIKIKATNLDLGIEIEVPVKVIEQGTVALPGNILSSFLTNLQDEKVVLESVDGIVSLSTKTTTTTVKTFPYEDFPIIPKIDKQKTVSLDASALVDGLRSVWYSAAVTSMKPELSAVYIYSNEDSLVFVSTDSFRLAEKMIPVKKAKDFSNILIPFKNIPEIIRALEGIKGEVNVYFDSNQVAFEHEGVYLVSRVIDGSFPDYKQIIPKEYKTEVVLLKQDLLNALKLANVFSDTFNQIILRVIPGEKLFEITTKNTTVGENHNILETVLKGEDLTISFNYKYIIDCFQSIKSDSLSLSFSGLGKPVLVKGVSDRSFLYIVMPMNK